MPNNDEKKVLLKVTDLKQWFPLKKTKLFQKEQEYIGVVQHIEQKVRINLALKELQFRLQSGRFQLINAQIMTQPMSEQ